MLRGRVRRTATLTRVLVPREIRVRYRQSVLDVFWALLTPVVVMIVYGLVLTQSFDVTGQCAPYLTSAWTGLVLWTFFSSVVGGGATSLVASTELVTKVYFPREALPLAVTGAALPDLGIGVITIVAVALVQGVSFNVNALWALLPLTVLVLWSAAIGIVVGVVAAFVRDVIHGVHLVLRVAFFGTPVMYEASLLPTGLKWTAWANPVAVAITGLRQSLLCGSVPDLPLLVIQLLLGASLLCVAVLYTASVETRIADVI